MDQSATYWDRINRAVENESMPDLAVYNDLVYKALKLWLKEKAVQLESEMFKALLSASRKLALSYLSSGSEDMAASCESSFFYHTFTARDGLHTDEKLIQQQLSAFWPSLKSRIDAQRLLETNRPIFLQLNALHLGKLFDRILEISSPADRPGLTLLLNEFAEAEIESQNVL